MSWLWEWIGSGVHPWCSKQVSDLKGRVDTLADTPTDTWMMNTLDEQPREHQRVLQIHTQALDFHLHFQLEWNKFPGEEELQEPLQDFLFSESLPLTGTKFSVLAQSRG